MKKILVSACLAGCPCRYDGRSNTVGAVKALCDSGQAVAFCPECAGGLPTPRAPAEITGGRVITQDGADVSAAFEAGAAEALALCRKHGMTRAVLKAKSPSCGCGAVYDGTFSGALVPGDGVTAALLKKNGIHVTDEHTFIQEYKENTMDKQTIGVVFGGQSGEHEVSCVSAYNVLGAIDKDRYTIVPIGIRKDGSWAIYSGPYENIRDGAWKDDTAHLQEPLNLFEDLKNVDVFFPVLHGPMGEDGTIQGVFEMLNKPYVGCGVLASAVGMDKVLSKIAFEAAGIPTCRYEAFTKKQYADDPERVISKIADTLGFPVFVKPANMGSSVGITKAHNAEELSDALALAFTYDRRVIVEEAVNAREIECAVLEEDGNIQTAVPGEIIPSKEFYDYEAKYESDGGSVSVIPAEIPQEALRAVQDYAAKAFEVLDASGLTRVDFFYDKTTGDILINEVNTMPGFTPISMYSMMWEKAGVPYPELIQRLIDTAAQKRTIIQ